MQTASSAPSKELGVFYRQRRRLGLHWVDFQRRDGDPHSVGRCCEWVGADSEFVVSHSNESISALVLDPVRELIAVLAGLVHTRGLSAPESR